MESVFAPLTRKENVGMGVHFCRAVMVSDVTFSQCLSL